LCGRDDRNVSERIENEEVLISGHDEIGSAVDGEFEKHVIIGISAGSNGVCDGNHFGYTKQEAKKLLALRDTDVRIELGAREDVGELIQDRLGNQQLSALHNPANGQARSGRREEKAANERAVVDDDAF
jgi:hypothetical protein